MSVNNYYVFKKITGYDNHFFQNLFCKNRRKILHYLITNTNKYPKINKYLEENLTHNDTQLVLNKFGHSMLQISSSLCNYISFIETLKIILSKNPDLDHQDKSGATALIACCGFVCSSSSEEAVKLLCKAGANVNIQDNKGYTALHTASKNSNCNVVKILLDYGANINVKCNDGHTPLHLSSRHICGDSSYDVVKLLVKSGAIIDMENNDKCTALLFATAAYVTNHRQIDKNVTDMYLYITESLQKSADSLQVIKLLIRKGSNVNYVDLDGLSAVHYASVFGSFNRNLLDILAEANANFNTVTCKGYTPLHKCLTLDVFKENTLACLIGHNAKINACSRCIEKIFKNKLRKRLSYGNNCDYCNKKRNITAKILERHICIECIANNKVNKDDCLFCH